MRMLKRHSDGHAGERSIVISLPDLLLILRMVARSVLLAVAVLSFPWLRCAAPPPSPPPPAIIAAAGGSGAVGPARHTANAAFQLQLLLNDLRREGLLNSGDRAVFLGGGTRLALLERNNVEAVSAQWEPMFGDDSVDVILAIDRFGQGSFGFVDRVLKIGGIVAVPLSSDASSSLRRLPWNYRLVYIRRFGQTVVGIKKTAHACRDGNAGGPRRSVVAPEYNKSRKTRFLPGIVGNPLFKKHPRKHSDLEMSRLDTATRGKKEVARGEWTVRNVRDEDYVVIEAEAAVAGETADGLPARGVQEPVADGEDEQDGLFGVRGIVTRQI